MPLEKVRCFIAVPVDEAVIRKLQEAQETLAVGVPADSVRWTTAEQMHLTLKFLGSVPANAILDLKAAFRAACEGASRFRLAVEQLGGFPSLKNPRVLWVGLAGELEALRALQARIETATASWAQKAENRAFHPHLTLGRVRDHATRQARRIGEQLQAFRAPEFGSWRVTEVRLMRSQLSPRGSVYTTLGAAALGGDV